MLTSGAGGSLRHTVLKLIYYMSPSRSPDLTHHFDCFCLPICYLYKSSLWREREEGDQTKK